LKMRHITAQMGYGLFNPGANWRGVWETEGLSGQIQRRISWSDLASHDLMDKVDWRTPPPFSSYAQKGAKKSLGKENHESEFLRPMTDLLRRNLTRVAFRASPSFPCT
jgi:hypothetical protein